MSRRLIALAASASGLALLIAAPAMAQTADAAEQAVAVDEIVVTAQRRQPKWRSGSRCSPP
jgi:iron complex outermembrane receptor protein